jgi:FdhD protein
MDADVQAGRPPLPPPSPATGEGERGEGGAIVCDARVVRYDEGPSSKASPRAVAVETPIEVAYGGQPFAVMMGTPADLEDFAVGFSLTEGVVERYADSRAVEARADEDAARVNVALNGERLHAHLARRRAVAGRTGCGICGIEDLDHLPCARARATGAAPALAAVGRAVAALEGLQPLNALTRAVHAAAWVDAGGDIQLVREDVGRHNALDKCVGALVRAGVSPDGGFFLVTSRCSYEMVTKAAAFGATALVSVSAPTTLALRAAQTAGVYLLAVARRDGALHFEGP